MKLTVIYMVITRNWTCIEKCSSCFTALQVMSDIMENIIAGITHDCLEFKDVIENVKLYIGQERRKKNQELAIKTMFKMLKK